MRALATTSAYVPALRHYRATAAVGMQPDNNGWRRGNHAVYRKRSTTTLSINALHYTCFPSMHGPYLYHQCSSPLPSISFIVAINAYHFHTINGHHLYHQWPSPLPTMAFTLTINRNVLHLYHHINALQPYHQCPSPLPSMPSTFTIHESPHLYHHECPHLYLPSMAFTFTIISMPFTITINVPQLCRQCPSPLPSTAFTFTIHQCHFTFIRHQRPSPVSH